MELTSGQAGEVLGISRQSIWNHIVAGRLPARRFGVSRRARIHAEELRTFAEQYGYPLDEATLARLAEQAAVN